MRQPEAAHSLAGQHFVSVLQQMLSRAQQMSGVRQGVAEAGVVAGRRIIGHRGVHTGAAHVQPGSGCAVHVPPAAGLDRFRFVRLRDGVEWPVVVMARVDGSEGGALHFAQEALVHVRIVGDGWR